MVQVPFPGPGSDSGSRKRARSQAGRLDSSAEPPAKDIKGEKGLRNIVVKHALLAQYYPEIQTLRQYALSRLPSSSRIRRKKIALVGSDRSDPQKPTSADEQALGDLLDSTLVGRRPFPDADPDHRWNQWVGFSQKGDESYVTLSDGLRGSIFSQSEIVDFVIWLLFSREQAGPWPKHILCDGFRRQAGPGPGRRPELATAPNIPGLYPLYPNQHAHALKQAPWPQLLLLLGKEGERIMIDLLVDCAVFRSVKAGKGNFYQLSGAPISELEPFEQGENQKDSSRAADGQQAVELRPSEISFIRSRMLYARAALNARGLVHFGLRHIHVLNRYPPKGQPAAETGEPDVSVVHVMMYIFPRQFGLHNVFTSVVDRRMTAQRFQDYTLREEEITAKFPVAKEEEARDKKKRLPSHIPKRLRGKAAHLVGRLQVFHTRCSYTEMLHHYCPVPGKNNDQEPTQAASTKAPPSSSRSLAKHPRATKKPRPPALSGSNLQYTSITDLATPAAKVSAFCQAVLSKVIPNGFWGDGTTQAHNKSRFLKEVHRFIHLRRFESMCLHEVMQGMKINEIEWLAPPKLSNQKTSQSDTRKRTEIFYEFLYYLFDSFLIPLIRSNFYVTESNVDRYRLFFFRHDVWRYVAEPAMATLKTNMFEEVKTEDARRILESRRLGYGQVRLLPKQTKMRPIMNLRRRTLLQGNKKVLGRSINSTLVPISSVLKLEKSLNPDRLGSSLFSVGDIYQRIKAFKIQLGDHPRTFYFAKVDVQAAFDSIPQAAMMELLQKIPGYSQYHLHKHAEVSLPHGAAVAAAAPPPPPPGSAPPVTAIRPKPKPKPTRRWHATATAPNDARPFTDRLEGTGNTNGQPQPPTLAERKQGTVFVGSAARTILSRREVLALASAHVGQHLVRIGKKYYRQRAGIPQGSVLSTILCSYFYADLEREVLGFLGSEASENAEKDGDGLKDSLLMRLIDDFLLITTDREKAKRFVEVMHRGVPEYGVVVSPGKSLVNFELVVDGVEVPRVGTGEKSNAKKREHLFPYCGLLIGTETLAVSKGQTGRGGGTSNGIFNSLTVEYSRSPGMNFKRKVINAFKIQSHLMFFDMAHNFRRRVLGNIYAAFSETATKMWAYARCMVSRPGTAVVIDTIKTLIDVAFVLLTSKTRQERLPGYVCSVRKKEVAWLAVVACKEVLAKKQTGYGKVLAWLEDEEKTLGGGKGFDVALLGRVVGEASMYEGG